jgi:hypothetical protein
MDPSAFQSAKLWIVAAVGLSKDALHVHVGLALFLTMVWLFRKTPRSLVPLLAVLGLAALGEVFDARDDFRSLGHWRWQASLHDVLNTTFWPAVLWVLWRTGAVFTDRTAKKSER